MTNWQRRAKVHLSADCVDIRQTLMMKTQVEVAWSSVKTKLFQSGGDRNKTSIERYDWINFEMANWRDRGRY